MPKKILCIFLGLTVFLSAKRVADATFTKQPADSPQPPKMKVIKKIPVKVTMYYGPEPGQARYVRGSYAKDVRLNGAGKETRSGTVPDIGTAAADWQVLKKGTKFRILECDDILLGKYHHIPARDIIFEVQDTGSAVKGRHIDLFVGKGDHGRRIAEKFGTRRMVIEVVQPIP